MKANSIAIRSGPRAKRATRLKAPVDLPNEDSVGYQIRETFLVISRTFRVRIASHDVTSGQWYFLRALWDEEGMTQRQLSERVGTAEPTTVAALRLLERSGLIRKTPHPEDRRAITVYLTPRGRALRDVLLPYAREVSDLALHGFSREEKRSLFDMLARVRGNLRSEYGPLANVRSGVDDEP